MSGAPWKADPVTVTAAPLAVRVIVVAPVTSDAMIESEAASVLVTAPATLELLSCAVAPGSTVSEPVSAEFVLTPSVPPDFTSTE